MMREHHAFFFLSEGASVYTLASSVVNSQLTTKDIDNGWKAYKWSVVLSINVSIDAVATIIIVIVVSRHHLVGPFFWRETIYECMSHTTYCRYVRHATLDLTIARRHDMYHMTYEPLLKSASITLFPVPILLNESYCQRLCYYQRKGRKYQNTEY